MRYVLQALAMAGDVVFFVALFIVAFCAGPGGVIIAGIALIGWQNQGGFMAWRPSVIKEFLVNAKRYGL